MLLFPHTFPWTRGSKNFPGCLAIGSRQGPWKLIQERRKIDGLFAGLAAGWLWPANVLCLWERETKHKCWSRATSFREDGWMINDEWWMMNDEWWKWWWWWWWWRRRHIWVPQNTYHRAECLHPLFSPFPPSQGANVQSHCPPPICCPDLGVIIMRWDVKLLLTGGRKT